MIISGSETSCFLHTLSSEFAAHINHKIERTQPPQVSSTEYKVRHNYRQ